MSMIILKTPQLLLRTWQDEDIDAMTAINEDPKVYEFLPGPSHREQTTAMIRRWQAHYQQHGFALYAVEHKNTHELLGFVGLNVPSFEAHFTPAVEIGWRLGSQYWNQGYATEAAKAVLDYGFNQLGLEEIVSFTVVKNYASRRVMEKIGLEHNPNDDFDHPLLERNNPLCRHVLYRWRKENA